MREVSAATSTPCGRACWAGVFHRGRHARTAARDIINKTMAAKYFPGEDPIGRQFGDRTDAQLAQGDRRRRRRHPRGPAQRGRMAGGLLPIRAGPLTSSRSSCARRRTRRRCWRRSRRRFAPSTPTSAHGTRRVMRDRIKDSPVGLPAPVVDVAGRRLCGAGAAARRRRALRRDRVLRESAHARDRPAPGDGRAAPRGLRAHPRRGRPPDRCWVRDRRGRRHRRGAADAHAALRDDAVGRPDAGGCRGRCSRWRRCWPATCPRAGRRR